MALMSEFQKEREAVLKNGTPKEKIKYIWDYYKWHIIIPILIISFLIWYIVHIVTAPDTILNGVMLNVYNTETESSADTLLDDFYKEQEIDSKKEEINLNMSLYYTAGNDNANYETTQVLMAWLAAGQLDFITGDAAALTELAYRDYLTDLREYLTDEQIAKYEPYFLYMDNGVLVKREEMLSNDEDITSIEYPDCTKPEDMDEPIPVMIDMRESEKLAELYGEMSDILVVGITVKETNKDMTLDFIDYLME